MRTSDAAISMAPTFSSEGIQFFSKGRRRFTDVAELMQGQATLSRRY